MSNTPGLSSSAYNVRLTGTARPTTGPRKPATHTSILTAALYGLGGGIIGAATASFLTCLTTCCCTHRSASASSTLNTLTSSTTGPSATCALCTPHTPGHVLTSLLSLPPLSEGEMGPRTHIANILCGGIMGVLRGIVGHLGFRGPFVDFMIMGSRVWADQGLECVVGVGRVPWTWPVREQVYELAQKAIWAFVTGYLVDRWVV